MDSQADPQSLCLQVGENRFTWNHPKGDPAAKRREVRRQFRHALYRFLLSLNVEAQNHVLIKIRNWSGLSRGETAVTRAMTHDELIKLADGGLIQLGAHTRHHSMLPMLSPERQKDEILSGKQDLEDIVGKPVEGFAYPNGRAYGITKQIVCEAGFAYACTSLHDVVRPASDLYELTRFWQKDVDGDKFLQGLSWWMKMQKK
jgi:peptidoglycan/xylan/chitin deacetylase (PgdA/CDA1 family)